MKKFVINVLVFFTIIVLIDCGISVLGGYLQSHAKGGSTKKLDDLVMKDTHDILILGSSRAVVHYDTPLMSDLLDVDAYNAGYAGNGVVLSVGLLEMILERYQPKLVVFEVEPAFDIYEYAEDNNHVRYLKYLKPYYNKPGVSDIFKDVSMEEWYKVHSGLIRYNTEIIPRIVDNVIDRGLDPCGFTPVKGAMTEEPNTKKSEQLAQDPFKLQYLQKLVSLCKTKNVPLVFISSPKYEATDSEIIQPAKDIAMKNGVPYWDYYSDSRFVTHKEWFKDPMHLNEEGARVYSQLIAGVLSNMMKQ
jgi:hypothetical protein